jgi:hypothetical protein
VIVGTEVRVNVTELLVDVPEVATTETGPGGSDGTVT